MLTQALARAKERGVLSYPSHKETAMDALTLDELARLQALGPERNQQQVISLFASGRASQEAWQAMAAAVLAVSESSEEDLGLPIDRAILAHLMVDVRWGKGVMPWAR